MVICQGPLASASLCKYRDFDQPRVARASLAVAWQSQVDEMFFVNRFGGEEASRWIFLGISFNMI